MGNWGKWIGGGLGWATFGIIGGVIGLAIGIIIDKKSEDLYKENYENSGERTTQPGDFNISLIILSAAIMRADNRIMKSELEYVKRFFNVQFGIQKSQEYIRILRDILKKDFDEMEVAAQIAHYMDYSSRVQLLHYLWGIAQADGKIHELEVTTINRIASGMRISSSDQNSIRSMFQKNTSSDYKILGIDKSATDEEIKKAYRKMAIKNHPDKVSHLGDDVKKDAEEKFRKINDAYENIKKERGTN